MLDPGPSGLLALDSEGGVLLDITGADEQRRLRISLSEAGPWLPAAAVAIEDSAFHEHCGVDPWAVLGAVRDNLLAGRVVRGASTITMQVVGMQMHHPRTFRGKAIEAFRALQVEARWSKLEILNAWLNMAPFGGNLVGVEAASRAWLGKPAADCTLSEAALLVGLPNAPERLRPDRFPRGAVERRNVVLQRMLETGAIDSRQYRQALDEVILIRNRTSAPNDEHAGWLALNRAGERSIVQTTIDPILQSIARSVAQRHARLLPESLDIAIVLVHLESASVAAMIGSSDFNDPRDGQINGAVTRRSPGSALKPFVYAAAFEAKRLAPESIVDDAPLDLGGWRPRNIDRTFMGPMTAAEALRLSRNTPALRITRDLGSGAVAATLRRCGISVTDAAQSRAGLSMAVGGLEVSPLELAQAYAVLARGGVHRPLRFLDSDPESSCRVLSLATCAAIEESLSPPHPATDSVLPFLAAKTGTSSGHRDALAAGWNRTWAAVVWVGRFDDGPDPVLLGADAAMPVLQELLHHPDLATVRTPRACEPWNVRHAVGRNTEKLPCIEAPRDGDVLLTMNGSLKLTPALRTHRAGSGAVLFVDGTPMCTEQLQSITLELGRHELSLVEPGRTPHAITVHVRQVN